MADLKMSGDIGFEELSPQLQTLIESGGNNTVALRTEILSVTATEERQMEFDIPKSDYIEGTHIFELRLGSVWIHPDRFQIQGNKVVLEASEAGIAQGRRLDFVFYYLEGNGGTVIQGTTQSEVDGSKIVDGTITKEKLDVSLQDELKTVSVREQYGVSLLNGWTCGWGDTGYAPIVTICGDMLHVSTIVTGGDTTDGTAILNVGKNTKQAWAVLYQLHSSNMYDLFCDIHGNVTIADDSLDNSKNYRLDVFLTLT